jgi:integrase/recombinase XerC
MAQGGGIVSSGFNQELFSRWIAFIDATPKTVQTYTRAIKQFLVFLKDNDISQPQRADIISYKDYLKAEHKPTTVQNYLMAVKQFFKWTAIEGIYPNVADHVKGEKLDKGFKKDYLTTAQVKKLLGSIDRATYKGKRDYALLALMITTGLRTIEIERANIEDLRNVADFTALYIQGKGRTDKNEYVKVESHAEEAIREYLKARGKAAAHEPLFISIANRNQGGRMTTRSISRVVKEALIGINLDSERLTAHSLRHTAGTLNLLNGGSLEETQQLLRHSNLNTTLIYSHALERANNNSENRIGAAVFG